MKMLSLFTPALLLALTGAVSAQEVWSYSGNTNGFSGTGCRVSSAAWQGTTCTSTAFSGKEGYQSGGGHIGVLVVPYKKEGTAAVSDGYATSKYGSTAAGCVAGAFGGASSDCHISAQTEKTAPSFGHSYVLFGYK